MAPNSRPPLTSRIRASFEGRRKSFEGTRKLSKSGRTTTADSNNASQEVRTPTAVDSEVSSPLHTNGFIAQDPESIRNAVDQAINGEAFQTAIAANLAKLIKPSIKSALDTIQPVVEAVYSHELLLRKTNQSVEDVLSRMDTNAETAAARRMSFIDSTYVAPGSPADGDKSADAVEGAMTSRDPGGPYFEQFKQLLEEHNAKTVAMISEALESNTTKIAELAQGVSDINESIGPTKESIDSLKSTSEQAATTSSVLQAQLDQLKVDIGQIIEAIGADLGKNIQAIREKPGAPDADLLSSQTTKLDLISTDLAALKGHADTVEKIEAISAELEALKTSVEAGNAANTDGFTNVLAAVEQHATVLTEIKEKEAHPDILAALQQSNDSHALHTSTLLEMKERSLGPVPAPVVSESGSVDHSPALQTIQADLIALKENIAAGLTTNTDLGVKINTVLTTIENHKSGDPAMEILAAVKQCNESHVAHAAALEGLKPGSADVAPELGTQVAGIVGKLDEQSAALEEIKAFGGTHAVALEGIKSTTTGAPVDASDLTTKIAAIISKLDIHTDVLDEIKGATSTVAEHTPVDNSDLTAQIGAIVTKLDTHAAMLDEIKGLSGTHATALENHGTALESIKSVAPESALVDNDNLTTQLSTIVAKLDSHAAALDEIKDIGGSHITALERIGSTNPEPAAATDTSDLTAQITAIVSKLDEHTSALDEIKGLGGSHATALESHGTALEGIKSLTVLAPKDENNTAMESQIAAIVATLEAHGSVLDEVRTATGSHVTALESHGSALESLKSLASASPADGTDALALETKIGAVIITLESHGAALDEIKVTSGSHSSLLDEIKTFGTTHASALEGHGTILEDIKSRSVATAPTSGGNSALEAQITDLAAKVDSHTAVLDDIKANTGLHSLVLDEIKLASTTHADALEDIRSPGISAIPDAETNNLAALEIQIGSIISTLETHSAAWNEIKARPDPTATAVMPTDSGSESGKPEGPFATIIETLMLHTNILNEIKEDVSAEILTALHDMGQVQANQTNLLSEIREADLDDEILTLLHASSESHSNHSSALDKIYAAVLVSNDSHTAHAASLDEIKSRSIDSTAPSGEAPDLSHLKEKISSITEKLEEYNVTLSSIKEATDSSNDSHAAHATALDEIKSRFVDAPADGNNIGANETQIERIVTKLEDHTLILSAIKDATITSNDSHTSHAAILGEINDATLASKELHSAHTASITELKEAITGFNDNHAATLSEIKDATLVSRDAHASHTAAFTELKSIQPAPTPAQDTTDLSALEAHVTSIINTLESQSTTLSSIKEGTATTTPEILAAVQVSHDLLTSHGLLLESIKEGSSHADILSNISELKSILEDSKAEAASHGALVKDLHTETKDSHSNLASAIGALALGGAAGAGATALLTKDDDSSSAILDEVKAVRALVSTSATNIDETKEKVSSLTSQIEINHTTITTSISTLGDEIKSEIDASGTGIVESITALDSTVSAMEISPLPALSASLEQHGAALKSLSAQIETIDDNLKENTTQITTLHNGVHLNDTGVEQLKDHVVSRSVTKEPTTIPEGAWFGSARSGSRSPTLSRVVSRSFVEPVYEVVKEVAPSAEEVVAEPALEPESLIDEEPTSKEIQVVENLPKSEEIVGVASLPDEPLAVDEAIVEPGSEALVEEESVPQEVEVTEDLLKVEESAEAFSPPEEPLVVHESATDPETMDEVVDDIQPSTEELAVEPEILIGDQLVSKEIDVPAAAANLPGVEEVTGTDSLPQDPVAIDNVQPSTEESIVELVETVLVDESAAPHSIAEELTVPLVDTEPEVHIPSGNSNELEIPKTKDEPSTDDIASVESSLTKSESALAEEPIVTEPLVGDNAEDTPMNLSDPPKELGLANDGRETCSGQSVSVNEAFLPEELALPEGSEVIERGIHSGESSVTDSAAPNLGEDHRSTTIETDPVEEEPMQVENLSTKSPDESQLDQNHANEPEGLHTEEQAVHLADSSIAQHLEELEAGSSIAIPGSPIQATRGGGSGLSSPVLEQEPIPASPAPESPLPTHEVVQPSSPFIESPTVSRESDEPYTSSPVEHATFISHAQQNLLGDRGLDSGHATPRDEARSNPFEDSDNLMSPASVFSPQSVLSPESETEAPVFPTRERMDSIDEGVLRSSGSDTLAAPPAFTIFPSTSPHAAQEQFEDSDNPMTPASGYDAHGLPHMTQESPIQSRQFETSHIPSSPQFEHSSALQSRGLQRESSFDYQQENYEPALLPRNFSGQSIAFEDDDFRPPQDERFASSDIRQRSPLQPLENDDFRAGQYERYSPELDPPDLRQRSPAEAQYFNDSFGEMPDHLELRSSSPAARERSPIQPFEDDYQSPHHQRHSPEAEQSSPTQHQYSPVSTPPRHLPPHLQLDTPAFRSTSPIDPYGERDEEIVSPSSEFAVPITPALATQPTTSTSQNPLSPDSKVEERSSVNAGSKGKSIASPGMMSPDLGSPAEFGFSREETETEPESALASPASPVFSEGGTMVEKTSGKKKKGKKEKKEKGGGKKGKKEKVPFEMEGEDAE